MQQLTAKEQRNADKANAAFERELRGDFDNNQDNDEDEDRLNNEAGSSQVRLEVAQVLDESTVWTNPSEVEADMVWSRLEAHFERHHMDVSVS